MKNVLITGAGGYVGGQLSLFLAKKGITVNAMHRPGSKVSPLLSKHPNIKIVYANLLDVPSLIKVSAQCDVVFHLAAYAYPWAKNIQTYYDINVGGTINVLEACKSNSVSRVVITATAGTFGPQLDDSLITEDIIQILPPFTEYERTKRLANEKAQTYIDLGMDIVFASPTRIFGPGELSASNAVTTMLINFMYKGFRFLPGDGNTTGNYAFVSDVVNGIWLVASKGKRGENYILGGENMTYRKLLSNFGKVTQIKRSFISVPINLMLGTSKLLELLANTFGIAPAITPPFVRKYTHNWATDISKAKIELGYTVTPVLSAISETAEWIKTYRSK